LRPSLKRILVIFVAAEASLAVVNLAAYFGGFDGDPLIHVCFAENASRGGWFQFNLGQPVSGVTSLSWLAAGALGWSLSGIKGCLFIYDGLILLSWLGGAICLGYLTARWGGYRILGVLVAAVFLGFPGIAANGLTGMENMTFGFFVFLFVLVYTTFSEKQGRGNRTALSELWLGILLALAVLTRPEGFALAAAFAAIEIIPALSTANREEARSRWKSLCLVGAIFLLIVLPIGIFHFLATHHIVPGSGMARLMHSRRLATSFHLFGPFWFYPRTLARLAIYLPLAAGLIVAFWISLPRRGQKVLGRLEKPGRSSFLLAVWAVVLGIGLYSFVTGAVHTNRYTIWIVGLATAIAFSIAGRLLQAAAGRKLKFARALLLIGISCMFLLHCGETYFRLQRGDQKKLLSWSEITGAVKSRQERTDELIRAVEEGGCKTGPNKVGLLLQEVQARLAYDDRVVFFSRDGRTHGLSFDRFGCPDLIPVLRSPDLMVIMDDINGGTIQGCIKDPEGLRLSELYKNDNLLETAGWKKVLLKRYWRGYEKSSPNADVFPALIRTCR